MSQHFFNTTKDGIPIEVLLGWDRPLGHFFMVVRALQLPNAEADGILYSNLDQPDPFNLSMEDYWKVLFEMEIDVPDQIFEQVKNDLLNQTGNRRVVYAADGSFSEE